MAKSTSNCFYYPQALSDISAGMESDFKIINQGKEYPICSFVAANISAKIYMLILEDAAADSYTSNLDISSFDAVIDVLNGKTIKVEPANCVELYQAACEFMIEPLAEEAMNVIIANRTPEYLVGLCQEGFDASINIEPFINEIAANFKSLLDKLIGVPEEIIDMILQNPFLDQKIKDENIFDIITMSADIQGNPNSRLVKHIPTEYFNNAPCSTILSNPDFNVNTLRYTLLKSKVCPKKKLGTNVFTPDEEDIFNGIIRSGILPLVNSTEPFSPMYIPDNVLVNDDSYYCSNNKNDFNAFIEFDFSPNKIILSAYALKSWRIAANGVSPTSWVLESTEDGETWEEIDTVVDSNYLADNGAEHLFVVSETKPISIIRFRQVKNGNPGNKRLALSVVEFFGEVSP